MYFPLVDRCFGLSGTLEKKIKADKGEQRLKIRMMYRSE